jgi:hypothetical protein
MGQELLWLRDWRRSYSSTVIITPLHTQSAVGTQQIGGDAGFGVSTIAG